MCSDMLSLSVVIADRDADKSWSGSESELDSPSLCPSAFQRFSLSMRSERWDVFLEYLSMNLCFRSSFAVGL